MQDSRRSGWRGLVRAFALTALLLACDGPAGPDVEITLAPSGTVNVSVGDTLTVRANVQNATVIGAHFASSNSAVATVHPSTGLVTAVAVGEAVITATSLASSDATASVTFRVSDRPSSVVIDRVLSGPSLADYSAIRGVVNVQMSVEIGTATRLEILLDSAVACSQSFVSTASGPGVAPLLVPVPTTCQVNTAEFDAATGTPRFHNGPASLSARLLGADGRVRYQTAGTTLRLANRDTVVATPVATRRANDENGLAWFDGNFAVNVLPVIYTRGVSLTRATATYTPAGRDSIDRTDTAAPFAPVFEEQSLANVQDASMTFTVRTVLSTGEPGPGLVTSSVRYDNRPPEPGILTRRDWIGAETAFASLFTPSPNADGGGVGRVSARFYTGDPLLSDTAVINRGRIATKGSDLSRGQYRVAALTCDALENCVATPGFLFGVDLDPPTLEGINFQNNSVNPPADLVLSIRDDLSGVPIVPLEVISTLLDVDPTTATCGPAVDGVDLPGRLVAGICTADTTSATIPLPRNTPGYYTYHVVMLDRAGNRSAPITRTFLVDRQAPAVTGIQLPARLDPGVETTFSATATDDVDLTDVIFRLGFPSAAGIGAVELPFDTLSTSVGSAFDGTLHHTLVRTSRFPFVRTLTSVIGNARATALVEALNVQATDARGLSTTVSQAIPPTLYSNPSTSDPYQAVTTVSRMEIDINAPLCTLNCSPGERTTVRLTMNIAGAPFSQPFARVYFYRRELVGGTPLLIGSLSGISGHGETVGGQTVFRYSLVFTPPAGLIGTHDIFAVGVSSGGNALRNEPTRLELVRR